MLRHGALQGLRASWAKGWHGCAQCCQLVREGGVVTIKADGCLPGLL